jgi:hypothetical protein
MVSSSIAAVMLALGQPELARAAAPERESSRLSGLSVEAGDGTRTHDPQLGKLMLYQLSYTRVPDILAPQDFAAVGVLSLPTPTGRKR